MSIQAKALEVVSKSFNGNVGVNGEAGGGFGKQREEVSWVNSPSSLLASSSLGITLEDTLTLKGGIIGLGKENKKSPTLFISAKSIKATHIKNTSKQESNGLNLSTSIRRSSHSLGIALSGNTELSLLKLGSKKGVSYASIGSLNPKAEMSISVLEQTPPRSLYSKIFSPLFKSIPSFLIYCKLYSLFKELKEYREWR